MTGKGQSRERESESERGSLKKEMKRDGETKMKMGMRLLQGSSWLRVGVDHQSSRWGLKCHTAVISVKYPVTPTLSQASSTRPSPLVHTVTIGNSHLVHHKQLAYNKMVSQASGVTQR